MNKSYEKHCQEVIRDYDNHFNRQPTMSREAALLSGINNAIDTVIERNETAHEVYDRIGAYLSDGLNCAGWPDNEVSEQDIKWARKYFAILALDRLRSGTHYFSGVQIEDVYKDF